MQITEKTNVMRVLEQAGIAYTAAGYEADEEDLSGAHAAEELGVDPDIMYKTLVAKGEKRGYLVFCVPVLEELDLKKAAQAAGDKKVELLPLKELLPVTGYLRGGCSPVGMKKQFPTFIEETCLLYDTVYFSAGKRGRQVALDPNDMIRLIGAETADLIRS